MTKYRTLARKAADRLRYQILGLQDADRPRVIGVGLSKTATTSLCHALAMLGHRTIHYPPLVEVQGDRLDFRWPWWMSGYDAMADITSAVVYRELHARFPGATFILTVRDEDRWLRSCEGFMTAAKERTVRAEGSEKARRTLEINRIALGSSKFNADLYRASYRRHNDAVRAHFAGHPRFFEMDLTAGQGWAPLCAALGIEAPTMPFPHSNVRARETA